VRTIASASAMPSVRLAWDRSLFFIWKAPRFSSLVPYPIIYRYIIASAGPICQACVI
jgi:hypothetical protein